MEMHKLLASYRDQIQENLKVLLSGLPQELIEKSCESVVGEFTALQSKVNEELFRRKTGEEAGQFMENFVNVMANREENKAFVDYVVYRTHRTLNQGLIGLFFDVIKEEGAVWGTGRYDARNEASVKACYELSKHLEEVYLPFI